MLRNCKKDGESKIGTQWSGIIVAEKEGKERKGFSMISTASHISNQHYFHLRICIVLHEVEQWESENTDGQTDGRGEWKIDLNGLAE